MNTTTMTAPLSPARVKLVRLNPDEVKEAILTAPGESDAVVRVFRLVYPDFDNIKSVDGYPTCNKATWLKICTWMRDLSDRLNMERDRMKQVMPGGAWMNYGFTTTDRTGDQIKLGDWRVIPAATTT